MKKIRIFLASSINDLYAERQEISNFICRTLRKAFGNAVDFELEMCEDDMGLVSKERKQDAYNQYIRESDYLYILFYHDAGEFTVEEFQAAYDRFRETDKPKIIPFVKVLAEGEKGTEALETFIRYMREELQHYYVEFRHVDTVKLRILMALAQDPELHMTVKLQDSEVVVNEQILKDEEGGSAINVDNIPFYRNHDAIGRLRTEASELESALMDARMEAVKDPSNQQKWNEITRISQELNQKQEELHEFEMKLLETSMRLTKLTTDGSYITPRTQKAIELFEQGDMEEALAVLDKDAFEADLRRAEIAAEAINHQMEALVKERLTLIDILMSRGITKESVEEIISNYERMWKITLAHNLDLRWATDYMNFLRKQNDHSQAMRIGEKLYHIYKGRENVSEEEWANFCSDLAYLYQNNHRIQEAEELYGIALSIFRKLATGLSSSLKLKLAITCNNFANFYKNGKHMYQADSLYTEALTICRRLSKNNPTVYEPYVAMILDSIGTWCMNLKRFAKAEVNYQEALNIRCHWAEAFPAMYEPDVAATCNNLGLLYTNMGRYSDAETFFMKALFIRERLETVNPAAYGPYVAEICNNFAIMYRKCNDFEKAKKLYEKALKIYTHFANLEPSTYERDVALICYNLSLLYTEDQLEEKTTLQKQSYCIAKRYREKSYYCSVIYEKLKSVFE